MQKAPSTLSAIRFAHSPGLFHYRREFDDMDSRRPWSAVSLSLVGEVRVHVRKTDECVGDRVHLLLCQPLALLALHDVLEKLLVPDAVDALGGPPIGLNTGRSEDEDGVEIQVEARRKGFHSALYPHHPADELAHVGLLKGFSLAEQFPLTISGHHPAPVFAVQAEYAWEPNNHVIQIAAVRSARYHGVCGNCGSSPSYGGRCWSGSASSSQPLAMLDLSSTPRAFLSRWSAGCFPICPRRRSMRLW